MWAIVVKEFRQLRRDRRTVAMLFLLPFLFLVVFGYAASFDVKEIPTVVVGGAAELVEPRLPEQFAVVGQFTIPGTEGTLLLVLRADVQG
jgi:ABC-2 type transport system permease protein